MKTAVRMADSAVVRGRPSCGSRGGIVPGGPARSRSCPPRPGRFGPSDRIRIGRALGEWASLNGVDPDKIAWIAGEDGGTPPEPGWDDRRPGARKNDRPGSAGGGATVPPIRPVDPGDRP